MREFLANANYSNKYAIRYNLGDRWKSLPVDDKNAIQFTTQLEREGFLENERDKNTIFIRNDYDFFPVAIVDIKNITIEKLKGRNQRPLQEGGFFKYTCSVPINLEKFMIFNELNERTVRII
jgi:hypothetical protein